jgi:hypothetical protein
VTVSNKGGVSPHWFVFQPNGPPIGPLPTEVIAQAILAGTYPPDVCVAAPGGNKWLRALDVPNIARLIQSAPTRRKAEAETRSERMSEMVPRKLDDTERVEPLPATQQDPASPSSSSPPPRLAPTLESEHFGGWRKAR